MSKKGVPVSDLEINKFIKISSYADPENNFAGVYPSDKIIFLSTFTI